MNRNNYFFSLFFISLLAVGSCLRAEAQSPSGRECLESIVINGEGDIPLLTDEPGTSVWYVYTPSSDGVYEIRFGSPTGNPHPVAHASLVILSGNSADCDEITQLQNEGGESFSTILAAEAGKSYFFWWDITLFEEVSGLNWHFAKIENPAGLTPKTAHTIGAQQTVNVNHTELREQWFRFTSAKTGYVEVSNCGNEYADVDIKILDEHLNTHYTEDQCNDISRHRLFFPVEKDKTYYIQCQPHTENASHTFSISEKADATGLLCVAAIPIEAETRQTVDHSNCTVVWYTFSPSESGVYNLEYEKGMVEVFTGDCYNLNTQKLSNGDFYAEAKKTYLIRRAKGQTASYNWVLHKTDGTGNRFCQTAAAIGVQTGITADFSQSTVIWYRFTPGKTAYYEIEACSGSGTSVSILKGTNCNSMLEWVDQLYDPCSHNKSDNRFPGEAGSTYYLKYEAVEGSSFQWELRESEYRDNCVCMMATPVQAGQDDIKADHSHCDAIYYSFVPQETAYYRARFCDIDPEGYFSFNLHSGACSHLKWEETLKTDNDPDCFDMEFYATAGKQYTIEIYHDESYRWSLTNIGIPEGRICVSAVEVGLNAPQTFDKTWFYFTPAETAIYQAKGCGLEETERFDIMFAEGECEDLNDYYEGYSQYADDKGCINHEYLLYAGKKYYIRVTAENENPDANWSLSNLGLPEGKTCMSAAVAGLDEELTGKNRWHRFTPAGNAVYEIRLSSPNKTTDNTYIGIYTGTCDDLYPVAFGRLTSEKAIYFSGEAGKTYYLELESDTDESEDYTWKISLSTTNSNIVCANAEEVQAGNTVTTSHTLSDILWYRFSAPGSSSYRVKLEVSDKPDELGAAILSGICDRLVAIAEDGEYFYAEAGQVYYIAMFSHDTDYNTYTWKLTKEDINDHRLCRNAIRIQAGESLQARIMESNVFHYYLFTPNAGGIYEIEYCEPMTMRVYSDVCEQRNEIGDFESTCQNPGVFTAEAGKQYLFAFKAEEGDYNWSLLLKSGDVGLGSTPRDAVKVYPNPTTGIIRLSGMDTDMDKENIRLSNVYGQHIDFRPEAHHDEIKIDLSRHPKGIYLLRAGGQTFKILKK